MAREILEVHEALVSSDGRTLTDAVLSVARQLQDLGTGNASTDMGAVEMHALEIKNGAQLIADAIHDLAAAIREMQEENP